MRARACVCVKYLHLIPNNLRLRNFKVKTQDSFVRICYKNQCGINVNVEVILNLIKKKQMNCYWI